LGTGAVGLALAALLLAGCENDAASYRLPGEGDRSLTLIREQRWPWDKRSQVALVVARQPDCQRRHALNPRPTREARSELYQAAGALLLENGGQWYAIDTAACEVQRIDPPAAPALLGAFDRKGDKLRFTP
jgi:hypothetical protein